MHRDMVDVITPPTRSVILHVKRDFDGKEHLTHVMAFTNYYSGGGGPSGRGGTN